METGIRAQCLCLPPLKRGAFYDGICQGIQIHTARRLQRRAQATGKGAPPPDESVKACGSRTAAIGNLLHGTRLLTVVRLTSPVALEPVGSPAQCKRYKNQTRHKNETKKSQKPL